MPNKPFTGEAEIDFGEDVVRLVQLPASHTGGGDAAVLFIRRRVVHTGDAFFNGMYPSIHVPSGGSVAGCIAAVDKILSLAFDTVIPGHGPIARRADLERARAYYAALWAHALQETAAGKTAAQAVDEAPPELRGLAGLPGVTSLARNVRLAMEEAARPRASSQK